MIIKLTQSDVNEAAIIHKKELPGFLSELGSNFLKKFYIASISVPEVFTFIYKDKGIIKGLVTGTESSYGLNKKIIYQDIIGFGYEFISYFATHPKALVKMVNTTKYPGFQERFPELLSIAVSRNYQREGIGKMLFAALAREFKKRGIKQFKISAYDRLPSNGFYKKIGCRLDNSFDFLGEKMNYYIYNI